MDKMTVFKIFVVIPFLTAGLVISFIMLVFDLRQLFRKMRDK